jgi:hypothetical protein
VKKGWKLFILVSAIISLFVFLSAASCSFGPITTTYTVTVNNTARATNVYLYVNGSYYGTILAYSTSSYAGLNAGDRTAIMNSTGQWMQFTGGLYYYDVYSNVTFYIPSGGTWAIVERD